MGGLELWFDCCVLCCWIWLLLDLVGTSGLGLGDCFAVTFDCYFVDWLMWVIG